MSELKTRIENLLEATQNWLNGENTYLKDAINRTVREGYFSYEDTQHAIQAIRESISEDNLIEWCERVDISPQKQVGHQNVLCLHAGNFPLVGFQDAFASLLAGARYTGKISTKDPYLLPTFLNEVKKTSGWADTDLQWTHRLDDFEGMRHDSIIFAGSESSVPGVKQAISDLNLAAPNARYLIRTSHFSMAYLDKKDPESIQKLSEGILRYGGKGCRSVAVVVSPHSLEEVKPELTQAVKSFWEENPQYEEPLPKLRQQQAYNNAVQREQLWLKYFLVQEGGLNVQPDQDFSCYWVEGDEQTAAELANQFGGELQSIYSLNGDVEIPNYSTEPLAEAQRPPIDWKPDGTDTLEWLME